MTARIVAYHQTKKRVRKTIHKHATKNKMEDIMVFGVGTIQKHSMQRNGKTPPLMEFCCNYVGDVDPR